MSSPTFKIKKQKVSQNAFFVKAYKFFLTGVSQYKVYKGLKVPYLIKKIQK